MCFRNPVMKKQKALRAARTLKSCTDSYVSSTFLSSLCNNKKMVSDWTNFCGRYQHNQLLFVFLRFWFAVWVLYKQCFVNFDECKYFLNKNQFWSGETVINSIVLSVEPNQKSTAEKIPWLYLLIKFSYTQIYTTQANFWSIF